MSLHLLGLLFLCLNIFFVLAEFSLIRSQPSRLEVLKTNGSRQAALVLSMLKRLDHYLSAVQIGVTISTLGLGWVGEPALSKLFHKWMSWPTFVEPYGPLLTTIVAFIIITYTQIVFAELVPRSVAIHMSEKLALWIAVPLEIYYRIFRIPTLILSKSSILIGRMLGLPPVGEHEQVFSEEEVKVLLLTSQEKGVISLDRLLLIENLLDFSTLRVRDAMVPREKVAFLSTTNPWAENKKIIKTRHFSRYPLGDPDLDHVIGFIHVKDLVDEIIDSKDLPKLNRKLGVVQDSEKLSSLLKVMSTQGKHMLLCMRADKVMGIITLEDVVEEILGEIMDEFDVPNAFSLHQFLYPDVIEPNLKSTKPQEAIQELAMKLKQVHPQLDLGAILRAVNQRESQLPTAIGKGVAIPHARLPNIDRPLIALARSAKAVEFPAPDKTPVRLLFLILTPASAPMDQLRILSRIATLINNETVRKQMLKATSAEKMLEVIRSTESIVAG